VVFRRGCSKHLTRGSHLLWCYDAGSRLEDGADLLRLCVLLLTRNIPRSNDLFIALLTFYVQTWDEYHTKTLTLGVISGPVEGILTLCIVFAFTAFKGPQFWHRSTLECLGVKPGNWAVNGGYGEMIYEMAWTDWYMVYGGIVLIFATYGRYQYTDVTS